MRLGEYIRDNFFFSFFSLVNFYFCFPSPIFLRLVLRSSSLRKPRGCILQRKPRLTLIIRFCRLFTSPSTIACRRAPILAKDLDCLERDNLLRTQAIIRADHGDPALTAHKRGKT